MLKQIRAAIAAIVLTTIASQPVVAQLIPLRVATLSRGAAASFVASIDTSGWSAQARTPASLPAMTADGSSEFGADGATPRTFTVSRSGFDPNGSASVFADTIIVTKRVRQAYPNQATASAATTALSDYIYSTDSVAGVVNNSAEASPKPVAVWAKPDHAVVNSSLTPEIAAFHRNGIAAVVVSAVDSASVTCATATASAMTISGHSGDLNPVLDYAPTLNLSSCAAGTITVNARVYPKIGTVASGSVLDSSANTAGTRSFAPQIYVKSSAAIRYAYVSATGVDASGVTSTTASTAAAAPFLTIKAAIEKLKTDNTTVDGTVVRIGAGSFALATLAAGTYQGQGELIVERDPAATRATAIVTGGASAVTLTGVSWLRFRDLTLQKSGASFVSLVASGQAVMENINLDCNGQTTNFISKSSGGTNTVAWLGATVTGQGSGTFATANTIMILSRGIDTGTNGGALNFEAWAVLGSNIRGSKIFDNTRGESGTVVAFNKISGFASTVPINLASTTNLNGYALVQNVIEYTSASSAPGLGVSRDSPATGNVTHLIVWNNSFAGFWNWGRQNGFYDSTASSYRVHKLNSLVGNLHVSLNTKHDVYLGLDGGGTPNPTDAPLHTGGWSYLYGVGCYGEFARYIDANAAGLGSYFAQAWPGLGAKIGTASTGAGLDPLFTTYAGTTTAGAAGSGGGNYTIGSGSPAKTMVASLLPYDLAGNARATTTSAGAYQ